MLTLESSLLHSDLIFTKHICTRNEVQLGECLPAVHKAQSIPAIVGHVCFPSTQEVEAGRLEIQGHPQLKNEFKSCLDCMRPVLG